MSPLGSVYAGLGSRVFVEDPLAERTTDTLQGR